MCFFSSFAIFTNSTKNESLIGLLSSCSISKRHRPCQINTKTNNRDGFCFLVAFETFQRFVSSNSSLDDLCDQIVNQLCHDSHGLRLSPSILPVWDRSKYCLWTEIHCSCCFLMFDSWYHCLRECSRQSSGQKKGASWTGIPAEYDAPLIVATCIYLAGKAAEEHIKIRDILNVTHR